jgi:hypothetical protein
MKEAENIISRAMSLEQHLIETPDAEKQREYDLLLQQLEDLINPPSEDDDEDDEEA